MARTPKITFTSYAGRGNDRWYIAYCEGRQSEPRPTKCAAEANLEARSLLGKPAIPAGSGG